MAKERFVEDLKEGEQLVELFVLKSVRRAETRAGKPYLTLTLADKSGEISGPAWDNVEALEPVCRPGTVVQVCGMVQRYRDSLQLKVEDVREVAESAYQLGDFVAASVRSDEEMNGELLRVIDGIRNRHLKMLLREIFTGRETGEQFRTAPAAKGIHHAYLGGLLEHSLSMARVASLLAGHYAGIDRDLLVAGALLHDIGKTRELASDAGVIEYTDVGRLKGHLVIGCSLIEQAAGRIKGFPPELLTHVQHLVLSHHGKLEFGAPVVPMTPEALLLSFIDDMDAKMNLVEQLRRKMKDEEPQWSDYQRSLERFILLRPLARPEPSPTADVTPGPALKQQSLF